MNKKLLSGVLTCLLVFVLALPFGCAAFADDADGATAAFAEADPSDEIAAAVSAFMNEPQIVADRADLLSDAEELILRDRFLSIKERYDVNVAVCAVQSMNMRTVEESAESYVANESNLDGDTVILYIAMGSRDYDLFATIGRAEDIFFAKGREHIVRRVQPLLSDGKYYDAFRTFGDLCEDFLARDAEGKPYTNLTVPKDKSPICFVVAIGAGLLIGTMIVGKYKNELKTVRMRNEATGYVRPGSMQVTNANEMFLYSNVTRVKRQTESRSSGGHSSHTSGGGHTSGKF